MAMIIDLIDLIFAILTLAIIADAILSWLPIDRHSNPVARILDQITEPIYAPLRRFIPPIGIMDITPIIALIILQVLQALIHNLLIGFYYR